MENRLLLAFVLSLGVFIGWGYIMSIVEGPPPVQTELEKELAEIPPLVSPRISKQQKSSSEPDTLPKLLSSASSTLSGEAKDFPGKEINVNVSTGRVNYVLTNKGAMVKNILLTKHKTNKGEPIDLVDHDNGGILPLALESNNNLVTKILQNAYYKTSTTYLDLSEAQPIGKLDMELKHSSGLNIKREFTFHLWRCNRIQFGRKI